MPKLRESWVESANGGTTDFPLDNLPYGVFRRLSGHGPASIGVAIGECILDLLGCEQEGLLDGLPPEIAQACEAESLNALMGLSSAHWAALRKRLTQLLSADSPAWREHRRDIEPLLVKTDEVTMLLPASIGDYTDFYAAIHHARRVGSLFRPDNPLLPNYHHVPIGYHGRTSSIVLSGTEICRPWGQSKPASSDLPVFGPSKSLDFELEIGFFAGGQHALGEPVAIEHAESRIFGLCLVNDWSARDLQAWESQPLGPFLSKNFATSISPWVVPMQALEPFRVAPIRENKNGPKPLDYLSSASDSARGAIDLKLEVLLSSAQMRQAGIAPVRITRSNLRDLYWTLAQMFTHHSSNGCRIRPGDLMATGTVSGESDDAQGCLLEMTRNGAEPFTLPTGEIRSFLEDGDEVVFRGYCEREGVSRIGFGECKGVVGSSARRP